jgi:hypothetical protein
MSLIENLQTFSTGFSTIFVQKIKASKIKNLITKHHPFINISHFFRIQ